MVDCAEKLRRAARRETRHNIMICARVRCETNGGEKKKKKKQTSMTQKWKWNVNNTRSNTYTST